MAVTEDHQLVGMELEVRLAERLLGAAIEHLEPDDVALRDVCDVWVSFDRIERLAANAKTLLAARVEASGEWKVAGARSAASHLGRLSGSGTIQARRMIENSKALPRLAGVAGAMRAGVLSAAQVEAIVPAAAAEPAAESRLVGLASTTNITELREECLRRKAAADPDPDATHARIHAHRFLRAHTDGEGARVLSVRGTVDRVSMLERALEPCIDDLFERGRKNGRREPREAYAFDALLALAERSDAPTAPGKKPRAPKPRYLALLHVPFEALTRGAAEGEELCEIVGVGPIPVRVARELLGDAILKLVITKGVDVANVVHLGRGATAAQRIAVLWSKPKCANEACSSMFVQLDHRDPWAHTHHTQLDEIDPLCPHDHDLKTSHGWLLVEGTGRRAFVPPTDPRHPRNRPPP
jgi:hypothetical protein